MAKGKLSRLAVIGAAIGGVVFFWRKRKGPSDTGYGTPGPTTGETASGSADAADAAG